MTQFFPRLRILAYFAGVGSMRLLTDNQTRALAALGHHVTLLSPEQYPLPEEPAGVELRKVLDRATYYYSDDRKGIRRIADVFRAHWWNFRALERIARREKPDVVHVQTLFYIPNWPSFRRLSRVCPLVLTVHDVLPHRYWCPPLAPFERWMLGRIYRSATALIVHAESTRRELCERFAIPESRVFVVDHGDIRTDADQNLGPMEARRRLGLPEDRKLALFFGSIRANKGLELLLQSFREVVKEVPEATLVVAGRAQYDISEARALADELGDHVILREGFISDDEVGPYYQAADLVALPYLEFHSQSGVASLALSYGRASVATAVGGLPELVRDGKTGLVVHPNDPQAMAQAIIRLFQDDGMRTAMGAEAARQGAATTDWSVIANRMADGAFRYAMARFAEHDSAGEGT